MRSLNPLADIPIGPDHNTGAMAEQREAISGKMPMGVVEVLPLATGEQYYLLPNFHYPLCYNDRALLGRGKNLFSRQ